MILLRLFMYFLKPSNERLKKNANEGLTKMQIRLYRSLLKWLLKSYTHYAISDTISIDKGRIKVIHEYRDVKFENELARNGIDIRPHLLSCEIPFVNTKGWRTCCFKYFKWKDLKSIYIDDTELFIKHDHALSIDGNISAKTKGSSSEDIIIRSIVELKITRDQGHRPIAEAMEAAFQKTPDNRKAERPNKSLFRDEKIRSGESFQNDAEASPVFEEQRIPKRGFEIDTTF